MAEDTQVICVTHSAQIASLAGAHFLIQTQVKGERTYTHAVSYTHLAVYKRQIVDSKDLSDTLILQIKEIAVEQVGCCLLYTSCCPG